MAVPKKRKSKMKTRSRKSANMKLKLPGFPECPNCGDSKQAHRVCPTCGEYRGEQVLEVFEV
ncbi:MAG: 50S ribosomal protein L32 [bacterium]